VYRLIEDYLVKNQELELINQYMGDPILKYEEIRMMRESTLSYANSEAGSEKSRILSSSSDEMFVNGVTSLISVLSQLNRTEEARTIQKRAVEYYPDDALSSVLLE
jgi:hypothetical protein